MGDDPDQYLRRLQKGLRPVSLTVAHWHSEDDTRAWDADVHGPYSLGIDARGIEETCCLLIALASQTGRIDPCARDGCNNMFIQTRNRRYCSEVCKQAARRDRRLDDPIEKTRRAFRARLERRRQLGIVSASQEAECRQELNEARTSADMRCIEKKYGLEKRTPGPKPKSATREGRA
jgi:hypothetical protein